MEIKKRRRGIGLTVVALALLFCVSSTITLAGANGGAVVEVVPADQTVTPGESFSVDVRVRGVTYMAADEATLNFDAPGVMPVSGVTEGDFLKSAGDTFGAGFETIDNTNGVVKFAYVLTTPKRGVDGSGTLATINFDVDPAAAPGTYNLDLTNVKLADGDNRPITVDEIIDATVTIQQPVPGLSGIGMVAVIGVLAIVLAISVGTMRKRRK